MLARTAAVVPRYAVLVLACLLTTGAVAFAADQTSNPAATTPPAVPTTPAELTVPDVRGKAYVFAKGILEDAGFAWSVDGSVGGYAANVVAAQSPEPGTRVVDTGAPTVTVTLLRTGSYRERGAPENASPFNGTEIELAGATRPATQPAATIERRKPKPKPKPKARPKPKPKAQPQPTEKPGKAEPVRKPAFAVAGAPAEPLDEITLPARARQLDAWVDRNPTPSEANVRHWLYQHSWIVAGARFGWFGGAEALELLVATDRKVGRLWGVGSKSRSQAEQALAEVRELAR